MIQWSEQPWDLLTLNTSLLSNFELLRRRGLAANVIESPTHWLHGFIFRHDFEIIRDSLYKSCSRDYFYICRQHINVRKCSSPWPQHPVGPKRLPCHVLYGAGHCLGRTQSYVQTPPSPMATFDSPGSGCTDASSWLHPPRPAHSSPMVDCTTYHDWRATISIIRLDAG